MYWGDDVPKLDTFLSVLSVASYQTAVTSMSEVGELLNCSVRPGDRRPDTRRLDLIGATSPPPVSMTTSPSSACSADAGDTNLNWFHTFAKLGPSFLVGSFAKVRAISQCCRDAGKVELHGYERDGHDTVAVVVKRTKRGSAKANAGKEAREHIVHFKSVQREAECTLTEIGVYAFLAQRVDVPEYVLKMHAAFETGTEVWTVLEFADQGDLFTAVQTRTEEGEQINWTQAARWMWELLQAVRYLHGLNIGHRDISLENILLNGNSIRLMDFGQAALARSPVNGTPLRYFRTLGKPTYNAPECIVPKDEEVAIATRGTLRPGGVEFARSADGRYLCEFLIPDDFSESRPRARPCGYTLVPADIFAVGVCLFILASGGPPWQRAQPRDKLFAWVQAKGIKSLLEMWKREVPPIVVDLLSHMLTPDPRERPTVDDCLAHAWLAELQAAPVPVRRPGGDLDARHPEAADATGPAPAIAEASAGDPYADEPLVTRGAAAPDVSPAAEEQGPPGTTSTCIDSQDSATVWNSLLTFFATAPGCEVLGVEATGSRLSANVRATAEGQQCMLTFEIGAASAGASSVDFRRVEGCSDTFEKVVATACSQCGAAMSRSAACTRGAASAPASPAAAAGTPSRSRSCGGRGGSACGAGARAGGAAGVAGALDCVGVRGVLERSRARRAQGHQLCGTLAGPKPVPPPGPKPACRRQRSAW